MYSKEFRDKICEEYLTTEIGRKEICRKYNLSLNTLKTWLRRHYPDEYKSDDKARCYTNQPKLDYINNINFKDMTREQLEAEIIKKDFEIKRLKKKYPWLNDTEDMESDGHST